MVVAAFPGNKVYTARYELEDFLLKGLKQYEVRVAKRDNGFIDFTEQFLRKFRIAKKTQPQLTLRGVRDIILKDSSTVIVQFTVSIENRTWKRINTFIEDYNSRTQTIKTKLEAHALLVLLAIDPDDPWPND